MTLNLIVAVGQRGVIGRGGALPWHLSADLVRFRKLTMGHTLIMGRKTYESIGRPLPGRKSIVITRQADYEPPGADDPKSLGVRVARSLPEALALAADDAEAFIIGGAEIYAQAIPHVDRLHVTCVHTDVEGDTFFPEIDWSQWTQLESVRHEADAKNPFPYTFEIYARKQPSPARQC